MNCVERHPGLNGHEIAEKLNDIARQSGSQAKTERTVGNHLGDLAAAGKLPLQERGYLIQSEWKAGLPKAFILIELAVSKKKWENNQKLLIDVIKNGFDKAEHENLRLISVDAVLGAEFSVIVQVYSDDLHYIGRFVKEYLLTSDYVKMTRTIMVWPTDPRG